MAQSDENEPSITWWADGNAETWLVFWMLVAVHPTLDKGMNEDKVAHSSTSVPFPDSVPLGTRAEII